MQQKINFGRKRSQRRYMALWKLEISSNCLEIGHYVDTFHGNAVSKMCKTHHKTALHNSINNDNVGARHDNTVGSLNM